MAAPMNISTAKDLFQIPANSSDEGYSPFHVADVYSVQRDLFYLCTIFLAGGVVLFLFVCLKSCLINDRFVRIFEQAVVIM